MLRYIAANYPPGLAYVDVGASIGNHTLFFAQVMRACRIVSIEPIPMSANHLQANLFHTGVNSDTVRIIEAAITDFEGEVTMGRYHESNNAGMWKIGGAEHPVKVRCTTLDEALGGEPRVDVIKIDVEHANAGVIHGAKRTLVERRVAVYIECENDEERAEADLLLGRLGYVRTPDVQLSYTPVFEYLKE
jgi:FkbM family methyltransferase